MEALTFGKQGGGSLSLKINLMVFLILYTKKVRHSIPLCSAQSPLSCFRKDDKGFAVVSLPCKAAIHTHTPLVKLDDVTVQRDSGNQSQNGTGPRATFH